jgi:hypothetical protein
MNTGASTQAALPARPYDRARPGIVSRPDRRAPGGPSRSDPSRAVIALARSQVKALLLATPAFHALEAEQRDALAENMVKVAAYTAELAREISDRSAELGQQPVLRRRETYQAPVAQTAAAGDNFTPGAANQVARVTRDTLKAVAFPTFVAELIHGTFDAITQSSIRQMEAYGQLLENVGKSVDEFMAGNITDNQARDWLAQTYPEHIRIQRDGSEVKAMPQEGADERPAPNWQADLNLPGDVGLDESSIEEKLVPAARRKVAESRLRLLSTMVLMGVNRIVVTGGKIRATMGFHIDTTDRAHEEHASDFDFRASASGSFGYGPWSASVSTSIAYVSSTRTNSDSAINTSTDLTGEVEIHFKSDYFPVERFAGAGQIGRIQGNTAVPAANVPVGSSGDPVPWSTTPAAPPRPAAAPLPATSLPPTGTPLTGVTQAPRTPVAPTTPTVVRRVEGDTGPGSVVSAQPDTGAKAPPPADKASAKDGATGAKTSPAADNPTAKNVSAAAKPPTPGGT